VFYSLLRLLPASLLLALAIPSSSSAQQSKALPDAPQFFRPTDPVPSLLAASPETNGSFSPSPSQPGVDSSPSQNSQDGASSKPDSPQPKVNPDDTAQQTKRILWIIPNFRSVSSDTHLPALSAKEKFWLATQDSFDYSSFIYTGLIAAGNMASKSEPSFGQGASGYGDYFAHAIADGTIENYMVEAVVPSLVREDPRYYTLGRGGFFKRSGYAISRLFITRTDAGNKSPNISEIVGAGAAAGISNTYYFDDTNVWVKTYQRWLGQMIQDAAGNLAKEFWPDINRAVFHNKY
jgi:hypothetical protein